VNGIKNKLCYFAPPPAPPPPKKKKRKEREREVLVPVLKIGLGSDPVLINLDWNV